MLQHPDKRRKRIDVQSTGTGKKKGRGTSWIKKPAPGLDPLKNKKALEL